MLGITELLKLRGLPESGRMKFIRHMDKRCDMRDLQYQGLMELYQSYQADPVFNCDYIISFLGKSNSTAVFYGVFRVVSRCDSKDKPLTQAVPYDWFWRPDGHFYELDRCIGFDDLADRAVIHWGNAALAWHQWVGKVPDKEVLEILPVGYIREFPGYQDFVLSHDELVRIITYADAHREWHRMLAVAAGIYLIVDRTTGKQYVGSAYGEEGILGRWRHYTRSGHGDNIQLKALLEPDPSYANNFQYSILHTLPRTLPSREVIAYEKLFKLKLGSRAFGLNSN